MCKVVFIHGPPACGKLTIGKELEKVTGYKLFHNHLVIDLLLSLFEFGTPNFIKHREKLWYDLIGDAVSEGEDLIFTFNPEATVSTSFVTDITTLINNRGGTIDFVSVVCPDEEICIRIESESRKAYRKLSSGAFFMEIKAQNGFAYPEIPSEITIDSLKYSAKESAQLIADSLGLTGQTVSPLP